MYGYMDNYVDNLGVYAGNSLDRPPVFVLL